MPSQHATNAITASYVSEDGFSRLNRIYAIPLRYHWQGYKFTYTFGRPKEGNNFFDSTKRLSFTNPYHVRQIGTIRASSRKSISS